MDFPRALTQIAEIHAQIAKGVLDEAGIDSIVRSDNAGGMYPAMSGAELLVRAEDTERARDELTRRRRR